MPVLVADHPLTPPASGGPSPDASGETTRESVVRTLTLDRPEALNALTPQLLVELGDRLSEAAADATVRVVVLTGTGRAFSAGVDLKALAQAPIEDGNVSMDLNGAARRVTELLATMPKVTIAKVNGFCFTGALELALACDLFVAADEAKIGDTHTKWGLRPTWGMSARLIRAVGVARARDLSYTARTISGLDAFAYGMASHHAPLDELDGVVAELASTIAANSSDAIAAYKDLYRNSQDRGLGDALSFEYTTNYPMSGAGARLGTFGS
jgi:enoyl-CoA hydratase